MINRKPKSAKRSGRWNLIEVTPKRMQCGIGACPAVFVRGDGKLIVVGRRISSAAIARQLPGRVGSGETALEIDPEYFSQVRRKRDRA